MRRRWKRRSFRHLDTGRSHVFILDVTHYKVTIGLTKGRERAVNDNGAPQSDPTSSILLKPPETQALLRRHYALSDPDEVLHYLEHHPQLAPVLINLAALVSAYFAQAERVLRVVQAAPTRGAPDGRRLVLFIMTELDEQTAMDQTDRLMAAWWPDPRVKLPAPFTVDVAYGAGAAAVDRAVKRFTERHGVGYKAHLDVARRLLDAQEGSDEHADALAQFATALRDDDIESSIQPVGGEASVVLARLRRQHPSGQL
jgi:hypothetical protein